MIADDKVIIIAPGDWLYLDKGQQHAVHSLEESALLVTIMLNN